LLHRVLRIISIALITSGIVIGLDVVLTLVWKEPLSSIYASVQQGKAEDSLNRLEERFPDPALVRRAAQERGVAAQARVLADAFEQEVQVGEGIGRLEIPSIDLNIVAVQGTDTASLQKGPGHYASGVVQPGPGGTVQTMKRIGDGTAFPGQGKTIAIAGHRTTYLAPFRHIDQIQPGDKVYLRMPYGNFTYVVEKHEIVSPEDVTVVENVGYERLVLTACHPLYSAAQRYVQFAKLEDVSLFAAGQQAWQDP
jgi:sortase A